MIDFDAVKTIAVVGLSDKPEKASNRVAKYLQNCGYRVIPVNPLIEEALGEKAYPDIGSVPKDIRLDVIDIFRKSEAVLPIVEDALERGDAAIIWMQEGVINEDAAETAERAGKNVIMDKCILKEHKRCKLNF